MVHLCYIRILIVSCFLFFFSNIWSKKALFNSLKTYLTLPFVPTKQKYTCRFVNETTILTTEYHKIHLCAPFYCLTNYTQMRRLCIWKLNVSEWVNSLCWLDSNKFQCILSFVLFQHSTIVKILFTYAYMHTQHTFVCTHTDKQNTTQWIWNVKFVSVKEQQNL